MASRSSEDMGFRHLGAFVLVPLSLFVVLSLYSYDWKDISLLRAPPNDPPANLIGPVGAWMSFLLFMSFGIGAYLVPVACLLFAGIMFFDRETRVWPRAIWCFVTMLALVFVIELESSWCTGLCRDLNIADAGGLFGRIVVSSLLVRWLSPVGSSLVLWSFFVLSLVFLVEVRNVVRFAKWAWRSSVDLKTWVGEKRAEGQSPVEVLEQEQRRIEKRRQQLERELLRKQLDEARASETAAHGSAAPAAAPGTLPLDMPKAAAPPSPADAPRRKPAAAKPAAPPPVAPAAAEAKAPQEAPAAPAGEAPPPAREPEPPPRKEKPPAPAKPAAPEKTDEPEPAPLPPPRPARPYERPSLALLDPLRGAAAAVGVDTSITSRILVETLAEFGIEVEVTAAERGPTVTRYELLPAPGVKVEKIGALSNNLALALKAQSVRVQAPVPGKGVVGVEVPNTVAKVVSLREIAEGRAWASGKARLPLVLGKDVAGADLVADLTEMPHLLVAGATGSGKTVCMNSILAGLLMARTPEQLRLMLIDPKIVEFSVYNQLPHLVVPVITDPHKVTLGLRWAINEMEKRYKLFAAVGVRNIESYNGREIARQEELFAPAAEGAADRNEPPARLPYVVIIIDELADLMLTAQADIENSIARLAQLSRAVGIHMVIATQRPSVNVITGTIKANFPARIAFQVAQKNDSRIILDSMGAEKLLGRGDMLFLPPGTSKLVRAQGTLTTDEEIRRIVGFIKNQAEPDYEVAIKDKIEKPGLPADMGDEEDEDVLTQAVAIIRETQRASTSSLQRRLRIGYTRAARIMDILEERGIVGPPRGSDPREILIDLDGEVPSAAAGDDEGDGDEPR